VPQTPLHPWRPRWWPFRCHAAPGVACPRCGQDITDIYLQPPWFRRYQEGLFGAYGFPRQPQIQGMQVCRHCHEGWTVTG